MGWRTEHGLAPLSDHFTAGLANSSDRALALNKADDAARSRGHELGVWQTYGRSNEKAKCVRCGAEVRVPYSSQIAEYRQPTGPAVLGGGCGRR